MATSALRSTMKRAPAGKSQLSSEDDSCSSNHSRSAHRRYRSLSRFSRRVPDREVDERLVSTERGFEFPEISLDDLAVEFFDSFSNDGEEDINRSGSGNGRRSAEAQVSQRRGRSVSRTRSASNSVLSETESSRRRRSMSTRGSRDGVCVEKAHAKNDSTTRRRSVSRQPSRSNAINGSAERLDSQGGNSRRRRSLSVVRRQISDSESDADHFKSLSNRGNSRSYVGGNIQVTRSGKPAASDYGTGLRRPFTQTELKYYDGYSSQSSAVTDDERRNKRSSERGTEKIIQAIHSQKKGENPTAEDDNCGVYEAMRKELRHAVEEIRTELEQATTNSRTIRVDGDCGPQATDPLLAVSNITKNYATKLHESAKRKQELLAEMLLEEQRGKELSEIVKELLTEPNDSAVSEKRSQARKRCKDRNRCSNNLTEDAERYIEDFISNLGDTDISSFDDERSETSSSFGFRKPVTYQSPPLPESVPVEKDGVALPWLQWETSSDSSSIQNNNMMQHTPNSRFSPWDSNSTVDGSVGYKASIRSIISQVSCQPNDSSIKSMDPSQSLKLSGGETRFKIDIGDYLNLKSDKDVIYETWKQRNRTSSGSLLLCSPKLFP